MKIYMLIIMFLMIGALFVISQNNLALRKSENFSKIGELYFNWAGQVFHNSGQIVGYAVKLTWFPKTSSG